MVTTHEGSLKKETRYTSIWLERKHLFTKPWSLFEDQEILLRKIYEARLPIDTKVADMIHNQKWVWPYEWTTEFPELLNIPLLVLDNDKDDKVVWVTNVGKKVNFYTKQTWLDLRDKWHTVLWYKVEDKYRLEDLVNSIVRNNIENSFGQVVDKSILAASVYYIWQESNWRTFKDEKRIMEDLIKQIKNRVKEKLLTMKVKNSKNVIRSALFSIQNNISPCIVYIADKPFVEVDPIGIYGRYPKLIGFGAVRVDKITGPAG
nr:hypothetical protein [Tanacetum cinerariifolium]